jgi:drug/metabolite transporter (DMT)-like permease
LLLLCQFLAGVIYSHILGALVLHEKLALPTLAGGVFIFAGALMVTVRGSSNSSSSGGGSSSSNSSE